MFKNLLRAAEIFPDIVLSDERVLMRPPCLGDWPEWAKVREKNRRHLEPYEPRWGDNCLSREFFERRLTRQAQEWREGHAQTFLICDNHSGGIIGGMNINNICRGAAQQASLGYWIDKNLQGKGLMREAMNLTIAYCFEMLKLHRINAACLLHNERSKNLLICCGFQEEGLAKYFLQINGQWQDHILYGLPIEMWANKEFKGQASGASALA